MTTQELRDRMVIRKASHATLGGYQELIQIAEEAIAKLEKLEGAAINGFTVTGSTWFVTDGPCTAISPTSPTPPQIAREAGSGIEPSPTEPSGGPSGGSSSPATPNTKLSIASEPSESCSILMMDSPEHEGGWEELEKKAISGSRLRAILDKLRSTGKAST